MADDAPPHVLELTPLNPRFRDDPYAMLAELRANLEAQLEDRESELGRPLTTAEYPTPARRPANSRLDASRLREVYGIELPPWRESLKSCVARLLAVSSA